MKKFIVLGLFIFTAIVYATDPNQATLSQLQIAQMQKDISAQSEKYVNLQKEVADLTDNMHQTREEFDKKFDYQIQCNDKAINSVNTSISGASHALSFYGILLTVVGIVVGLLAISLGIYISRQVKNVKDIEEESKAVFDRHLKIRDEVRNLDGNIKKNMTRLYSDLKIEETRALVERLVEVPEDVENLSEILLSREISEELFLRIKKAYQSLSEPDPRMLACCKQKYRIIFFQHFSGQSLFDRDLEDEMERDYPTLMDCSFVNDIMKASKDFITATIEEGDIFKYSEKIKKFFVGFQQSRYSGNLNLYKYIYDVLRDKENRFSLYSILQQEKRVVGVVNIFSEFLITDYKERLLKIRQ